MNEHNATAQIVTPLALVPPNPTQPITDEKEGFES